MHSTIISRKGQVTIPAEYRETLGLSQGDRMEVVLEGNIIRLARGKSVTARTGGILAGPGPVLSAKALREAAEKAIAEEVQERSRSRPRAVKERRR